MAQDSSLLVLTLNIWGLWIVSKRREERVRQLSAYLRSCEEDVVLLQEVWVDADAQLLIQAGRAAGLTHAVHFRSGIFGSGLVTLSRHPFVRLGFWRYAAAGWATALTCGDYYAAKGVGWVRLDTPLGEVDVFNTHLHANYAHDYRQPPPQLARAAAAAAAGLEPGGGGGGGAAGGVRPAWEGSRIADDDDAGTRIAQLLELSEVVRLVSGGGGGGGGGGARPAVVGGDLNCKPDTLEVDLLRLRLPWLSDAWAAQHGERRREGGQEEEERRRRQPDELAAAAALPPNPDGFTCHAPGNSFQPRRQVPERIDYVWSSLPCERVEVALQRAPCGVSYSDHFAVRARLGAAAAAPARRGAALRLGGGGKAAAAANAQAAAGEGAAMPAGRAAATVFAAQWLLEESARAADADGRLAAAGGGFVLTALVYAAAAAPVAFPGTALRGAALTGALALYVVLAAGGAALVLMGFVGGRSQRRALLSAYRLLRVWAAAELRLSAPAELRLLGLEGADAPPPTAAAR